MSEKDLGFNSLLNWRIWLVPIAFSIVLIAVSRYNYLLFHTLAELFTVMVGILMLVVAFYTHSFSRENFFIYLGVGYFWIAILDFIHTILYKGMTIYPNDISDHFVQFWIANRYIESFLLLTAPIFLLRKISISWSFIGYGTLALLTYTTIMSNNFPTTFIEGEGLTDFKVFSEYTICFILLLALGNLWFHKRFLRPGLFPFLFAAIVMTIFSELAFTSFISVYGPANLIGHLFKLFSFWLVFYSIVRLGLQEPYEKLFESETRFRKLFKVMPIALGEVSGDGRIGKLNDQFIRIFGYTHEDIPTLDEWWRLAYPNEKYRQSVRDVWGKAIQTATELGQTMKPNEFDVTCKNGEVRLIEVSGVSLGSDFLATFIDLTEQKKSEKELRLSKENFHTLSKISPVGVFHTDAEGNCLYVNEKWRDITGLTLEQARGAGWTQAIHSEDKAGVFEKWALAAKEGAPFNAEYRFQNKDGKVTWVLGQAQAEKTDTDEVIGYVGTITDLNDRIAAEQERLKMQSQLEHTQRLDSLGILAGGIAHDFNNILTSIMGNAALAERKAIKSPQDMPKYLSNIVHSSEKAADLCKQMLAYSGKGRFQVQAIDLSTTVEETSRLLEVSISKGVILKYNLAENLPSVEADIAQMQQVIMNLVLNASDAIGKKSGIISICTGMMQADSAYLTQTSIDDSLPDGRYVYLEVSDTGAGMDEQTQSRLFEPFFTTKFTGHGLGMSAVQGIVRGHKGAIKVYSELGRGSTFKVILPMSEVEVDTENHLKNVSASEEAGFKFGGTILIVDDEETVRETASMMLEDMGFDILTAIDGEDGVNIYRAHQTEIVAVLMDMTMPKMDGQACFRELRRINENVKVVLSSGYNEQEATSLFTGKGLAGFIQKPYSPDFLAEKLQIALRGD